MNQKDGKDKNTSLEISEYGRKPVKNKANIPSPKVLNPENKKEDK